MEPIANGLVVKKVQSAKVEAMKIELKEKKKETAVLSKQIRNERRRRQRLAKRMGKKTSP